MLIGFRCCFFVRDGGSVVGDCYGNSISIVGKIVTAGRRARGSVTRNLRFLVGSRESLILGDGAVPIPHPSPRARVSASARRPPRPHRGGCRCEAVAASAATEREGRATVGERVGWGGCGRCWGGAVPNVQAHSAVTFAVERSSSAVLPTVRVREQSHVVAKKEPETAESPQKTQNYSFGASSTFVRSRPSAHVSWGGSPTTSSIWYSASKSAPSGSQNGCDGHSVWGHSPASFALLPE